jgi:hypothetical protein
MEKIVDVTGRLLKFVWPRSRWANAFYLGVGYVISHIHEIDILIRGFLEIFKK